MYADDTTAFVIANTVDVAINYLNIIADDINSWCSKNRLSIYCDKTEAMLMTRKKNFWSIITHQNWGASNQICRNNKIFRSHHRQPFEMATAD